MVLTAKANPGITQDSDERISTNQQFHKTLIIPA